MIGLNNRFVWARAWLRTDRTRIRLRSRR